MLKFFGGRVYLAVDEHSGMGKVSTHDILYAQLIIDGQEHGVNGFLVQSSLPGSTICDMGMQFGYGASNTLDNGILRVDHMRIPRDQILTCVLQATQAGQSVQSHVLKQLIYGNHSGDIQFSVQHDQQLECGGGYLQLLPFYSCPEGGLAGTICWECLLGVEIMPLFFLWMHADDAKTVILVLERVSIIELTWIMQNQYVERLGDESLPVCKWLEGVQFQGAGFSHGAASELGSIPVQARTRKIVKLLGRHSGFIAMNATLASRHVDCCLNPESPFYLEGEGGLSEFAKQRIKENGHIVIELTESSGQEYVAHSMSHMDTKDASGNCLLLDVGIWLSQKVKDHFSKSQKTAINLQYIDPTYMIRVILTNASDNIYCILLAHSVVHGAITGYPGQMVIGMDVVASEFSDHEDTSYDLKFKVANHDSSQKISGNNLKTVYKSFVAYYPLVSIADRIAKAVWEHYNKLTKEIREQVQSVGDLFLLTNSKRVEKAIQDKECNALLLKVNHIGSVIESSEVGQMSKRTGWGVITVTGVMELRIPLLLIWPWVCQQVRSRQEPHAGLSALPKITSTLPRFCGLLFDPVLA
ncbi:uncharacterized protein [Aristolochia californica]|uniref:uncharacterized protein n=1 Tax=Aristolochia californica TaxID=171875 RepID=UPI0035D75DC0